MPLARQATTLSTANTIATAETARRTVQDLRPANRAPETDTVGRTSGVPTDILRIRSRDLWISLQRCPFADAVRARTIVARGVFIALIARGLSRTISALATRATGGRLNLVCSSLRLTGEAAQRTHQQVDDQQAADQ